MQSLNAASVSVEWISPDNYRDIKNSTSEGRKAFRQRVFENLEYTLSTHAKDLPADQMLNLRVTDLKLAGKLRGNKVRVNPYDYPPAISFDYTLTKADGTTLDQGTESLRGRQSMAPRGHSARNQSFYYEKEMLSDWFKTTFK
ncbi:MAG: DUF3016 domain-containing protein [bacterium]